MALKLNNFLNSYEKVPLTAIKDVNLMSRVDEKFVFHQSKLYDILSEVSNCYKIVTINNKVIQEYNTKYLDTVDKLFFHQHHNGQYTRNKVRFREYVGSGLCFLEIKKKNNKKVTVKKRIKVDVIPKNELTIDQKEFVDEIIGSHNILTAQQTVRFNRMTFVHKKNLERLTIDINLSYSFKNHKGQLNNLVIAELKKNKSQPTSDFKKILKQHKIKPLRFSKYCMTTLQIDKNVKYNRFKEKLLLIKKILKT